MNNTDYTRYVLLAGMIIIGYLLVLAWQEDYGDAAMRVDAAAVDADPMRSVQIDTPVSVPEAPAAISTMDDEVPDVPAALATSGEVPAIDGSAASPVQDDSLVRVRTDTMRVWIDRVGGDLIKITLPQYPVSLDAPDLPFTLLDRTPGFIYTATSGVAGPDGVDSGAAGRPRYASAVSDFELSEQEDTLTVDLHHVDERGVRWTKSFSFERGSYAIRVEHRIENPLDEVLRVNGYAQIKRSAGNPPGAEPPGMGPRPYVGAAFTTPETRYEKIDFDDLDDGPWQARVPGGWVAMLQHYFVSAWVPDAEVEHIYRGRKRSDGSYLVEYIAPEQRVQPGGTLAVASTFYAGPKIQSDLEGLAQHLELTVDYGFLWFIADYLFVALEFFHDLVGNWGYAIILLTFLVKLILYPLSAASYRSMANMRKVAPQMKRLQERYAEDRQKLSQEMMNLYKKEQINPLGGCLPMLAQMPIFLALYWVLYESVELRQAPFALWIDDLSDLDPFFVLPLLMGASMFFQMSLNPPPPDPMQARIMKIMPVMFTVLFLFFPAGLVLYWLVNNLLSIAQQWYVTKQIENAAAT